ncbi:MAG: hypothetical protein HC927_09170, partial [Deltaproteobacteria bacterium]|nr:hypothetical protein [Deltaproteobacteria bacterium]
MLATTARFTPARLHASSTTIDLLQSLAPHLPSTELARSTLGELHSRLSPADQATTADDMALLFAALTCDPAERWTILVDAYKADPSVERLAVAAIGVAGEPVQRLEIALRLVLADPLRAELIALLLHDLPRASEPAGDSPGGPTNSAASLLSAWHVLHSANQTARLSL